MFPLLKEYKTGECNYAVIYNDGKRNHIYNAQDFREWEASQKAKKLKKIPKEFWVKIWIDTKALRESSKKENKRVLNFQFKESKKDMIAQIKAFLGDVI